MEQRGSRIPSFSQLGLDAIGLEDLHDHLSERGFREIGEGGHASVYEVPEHRDLVVRVANGVDGFAKYVIQGRSRLREFTGLHVPVVFDMRITDDEGLIVLAERLEQVPDDPIWVDLVEGAKACLNQTEIEPAGRLLLAEHQPRFEEFATALREVSRRSSFDTRAENFMLRGNSLVFIDPFGKCLFSSEVRYLRSLLPLPEVGDYPPLVSRQPLISSLVPTL